MFSFSEIIGKDILKKRLINNVLENELPHGIIISGQKGSGKKTIAKALAAILLCENPNNTGACMVCKHCKMLQSQGLGELIVIDEEKSISVDIIREINKNILYRPNQSQRKAYIICDGEKMTPQCQNALLKTLEEPPSYANIIITCNNIDQLIETIKSRSVILDVGVNSNDEVYSFLSKKYTDEKKINSAVSYSNGSIGKALELIDNEEFSATKDIAIEYFKKCFNKEITTLMEINANLSKKNVKMFLEILMILFKDVASTLLDKNIKLNNEDEKNMIVRAAEYTQIDMVLHIIHFIQKTIIEIESNAAMKMSVDSMAIGITKLLTR